MSTPDIDHPRQQQVYSGGSDERSYYEYERLKEGEIRILKLEAGAFEDILCCSLTRVELDDVFGPYETISYAWGNPSDTTHILCSGAWIKVTKNLYGALRALRYTYKSRSLWADALCINQKDEMERATQVQQMGRIYRKATRVQIWLGEETPEVKGALSNVLDWLERPPPNIVWSKAAITWNSSKTSFEFSRDGLSGEAIKWLEYQQGVLPPIRNLFLRPWWTRKWVIQELVRAQRAVFRCGQSTLKWRFLKSSLRRKNREEISDFKTWYRRTLVITTDGQTEYLNERGFANADLLSETSLMYAKNCSDLQDLEAALELTAPFRCTDARDHLYSLLGLFNSPSLEDANLLQVDYKVTPATVCTRLSIYLLHMSAQRSCLWNRGSVAGHRRQFASTISGEHEARQLIPSWACRYLNTDPLNLDLEAELSSLIYSAGRSQERGIPVLKLMLTSSRHNSVYLGLPSSLSELLPLHEDISSDNCVLLIKGAVVGEISDIEAGSLFSGVRRRLSRDIMFPWTEKILRLLERQNPGAEQFIIRDFFEFVTCGGEKSHKKNFKWKSPSVESAQIWLDSIRCEKHGDPSRPAINADQGSLANFDLNIFYAATRKLCTISTGHIGWVPVDSKVGDSICVIPGCDYLFVISPCGENNYNLIGACYIQGLMWGEALDLGLEEDWIPLN